MGASEDATICGMTPAVDSARRSKIPFELHEYDHDPNEVSFGLEAVARLGVPAGHVFKTLVVISEAGDLAVGIVPVNAQLSLKSIARTLGFKKAKMAPAADVERVTGYVLGGVSPLGQKRQLPTAIDACAQPLEKIYVSAGKRGLEISLSPQDLARLTSAEFASIADFS